MRRYASSHDDVTIETYYYGSLGLKRIHNIEIRVWVFDPLDSTDGLDFQSPASCG